MQNEQKKGLLGWILYFVDWSFWSYSVFFLGLMPLIFLYLLKNVV